MTLAKKQGTASFFAQRDYGHCPLCPLRMLPGDWIAFRRRSSGEWVPGEMVHYKCRTEEINQANQQEE